KLKERFSYHPLDLSTFEEVTSSFDDVFVSLQHSELVPSKETSKALQKETGSKWLDYQQDGEVTVSEKQFDFEQLYEELSSSMVPEDVIRSCKSAIGKLAFIYNLEPIEMSTRIQRAYDFQHEELRVDDLRKAVRN